MEGLNTGYGSEPQVSHGRVCGADVDRRRVCGGFMHPEGFLHVLNECYRLIS
jgi:hypothetical protein